MIAFTQNVPFYSKLHALGEVAKRKKEKGEGGKTRLS